jgi:hypothetical protein
MNGAGGRENIALPRKVLKYDGPMRPTLLALLPLLLFALVTSPARAAGSNDLDLPEGKPWVHEPTGFAFPPDLGTFTRLGGTRYDKQGDNISVAYGDRALRVLLTAFVYPNTPGMTLNDHFEQVKRELRKVNPKAKVLADGKWTLQQGKKTFTGRRATFTFTMEMRGGGQQEVVSEVYLLLLGDQFVKFRVTCPQDKFEAASERVGKFLTSLTLPESEPAAVSKE